MCPCDSLLQVFCFVTLEEEILILNKNVISIKSQSYIKTPSEICPQLNIAWGHLQVYVTLLSGLFFMRMSHIKVSTCWPIDYFGGYVKVTCHGLRDRHAHCHTGFYQVISVPQNWIEAGLPKSGIAGKIQFLLVPASSDTITVQVYKLW